MNCLMPPWHPHEAELRGRLPHMDKYARIV